MFSTIHITSLSSSQTRLSDYTVVVAQCEPRAKASHYPLIPNVLTCSGFAAPYQASFLTLVGNIAGTHLNTNNFNFYAAYMHFQEKSYYDSCWIPACIKQLLRYIYYVMISNVKVLEFVFYTTFHSKFIYIYKIKNYLMRKKGLKNSELI